MAAAPAKDAGTDAGGRGKGLCRAVKGEILLPSDAEVGTGGASPPFTREGAHACDQGIAADEVVLDGHDAEKEIAVGARGHGKGSAEKEV
jgi:hypothetical protein